MTGPAQIDLGALLTDNNPPANDAPLRLCCAELDAPLRYIFESDGERGAESNSWIEAIGAGKQVAALPNKMRSALPPGSVILHADSRQFTALVSDAVDSGW